MTSSTSSENLTYAVDIEAADNSVKRIQQHVKSTYNESVLSSGETSFGGCFAFDSKEFNQPVLVSGTDGVGTKSEIAAMMHKYDTIGIDLVAANIDDIAAQGAKPLFFLDYISVGKVIPEMMEDLVKGIAQACKQAGVALVGGEMSEHPELIEPGHFDLSGTAVGALERDKILPKDVEVNDVLIGIDSPGIRANGYTLVRDTFFRKQQRELDSPAWEGAQTTLGEELIKPSVLYSPIMQEIYSKGYGVKACAHITGGGLPGNVVRVLDNNFDALINRGTWDIPEIFNEIQREGNVSDLEMEKVFNLGIGYVVVTSKSVVEEIQSICHSHGRKAFVIGQITQGQGKVRLV